MSINDSNSLDRRVLRTKKVLKGSLIALMHKKDFMDITICEVVKVSDLNRGTFYKHYHYKEDLLDEIKDEVIFDLIKSFREPYHNVDTFSVGDLTSSAIKIFEHVSQHADFYEIFLKSTVLPDFQYRMTNVLKKLPLEDFEDKNPNSKVNKELQASFLASAIVGMIIEWVNDGFKYSERYMSEQLLEILNINSTDGNYKITKNLN
ncbi:MAG: TetR family transcriptional regulator C-terminal domain-containing protein [Bacillus sp. (in: Bacteria)]|nr:TetR family transcriptional regulator C-terminal domain-containing protein [Bacillus sp. (in: firmicutes)]